MENHECAMELHEEAVATERVGESTVTGEVEDEAVEDDGDEEYEDVADEPTKPWLEPRYAVNRRFRLRPRKRTEPSYEGKLKRIVKTSFRRKTRDKNVVIVRNTGFSSFVRMSRRKMVARAINTMENKRKMQEVEIKLWQLNL